MSCVRCYYYDWVCADLLLSYVFFMYSGNSISCLLGGLLHLAIFSYCFVLCCYCGVYRDIARLLEFLMCCVWLCDWNCTDKIRPKHVVFLCFNILTDNTESVSYLLNQHIA
jgi:hypothetical protein